jgi:hypothetical protein
MACCNSIISSQLFHPCSLRGQRGDIGTARRAAKDISMQPYDNPLFYAPWGASLGGVFAGCPAELLHQFLTGILKYGRDWLFEDWKCCTREIRYDPVNGTFM